MTFSSKLLKISHWIIYSLKNVSIIGSINLLFSLKDHLRHVFDTNQHIVVRPMRCVLVKDVIINSSSSCGFYPKT